ncbi:MAG: tetratricopeptide repeat protein [candidate division KSB1 bacterium]|nr:tetratricopeptide repeat protein [candidate division KSB1 bacterium]
MGLHSEIEFGERKLLIESSFYPEQRTIVSNVFDDGHLVEKREWALSADLPDHELSERLEECHRRMTAEYEILEYIQKKIRTVSHPPSNNRLGLVFLAKGLYREALREFTVAIKGDPGKAEYYGNLARALLALGRPEDALSAVDEGLERGPNFADLHNLRGLVLLRLDRHADAVKAFQEAVQYNPSYGEAHLNLALSLLATVRQNMEHPDLPPVLTRIRKALASVKQAVEASPVLDPAEAEPVFEAVKLQDLARAERLIEALRAKLPSPESLLYDHEFYLQFMYGGKGKDEEALQTYIQWLQEELQAHPEYPDLHNNLGVAYLIAARNLFTKAIDEFREALRINPNFERAAKNLRLAQNDGKGFLILLRAVLK